MVSQPFLYIYIYICVGQYTIAMVEVTTQEYVYNIFCIQYFLYKLHSIIIYIKENI